GDPAALYSAVRSAVRELDPELPVYAMRTMQEMVDTSMALRRTVALALLGFAGIALVLAVGGVYAMLSYVVGRRRGGIGIRVALGAQRGQVARMVVGDGGRLVVIGLLVGFPAALLASRFLESQLVGISASDPATYVTVAVVLLLTGAAAALVPARRAATVQPTESIADGA